MNAWESKIRKGSKVQSVLFDRKDFLPVSASNWLYNNGFKQIDFYDETDNFLRFRQIIPSKFKKKSFRTIVFEKGIKAIVGIPK